MTPPAIRPLDRSDWELLRDLRLHALRTEPGVFMSSFEREAALSPQEWQRRVLGPGNQSFGLFAGDEPIGITGVITWRYDPTGTTAMLVMSYIRPEHRGRGWSALLYEARLRWLDAQPQFTRVIVAHRASNEASRRAIVRYGFEPVEREMTTWPDGTDEDEIVYELRLPRASGSPGPTR